MSDVSDYEYEYEEDELEEAMEIATSVHDVSGTAVSFESSLNGLVMLVYSQCPLFHVLYLDFKIP